MLWLSLFFTTFVSWSHALLQEGFPYDLKNPDEVFEMPKKLLEISGLGLSPDGKSLVAIEDEDGIIFILDKQSGKIKRQIKFWDKGDYEGIEMVGEDIYVVKSTGTIYRVAAKGGEYNETEKYNFELDKENDVEGLGYDAAHNRLLLACKAKAGHGKEYKMEKGIYAFDLEKMILSEKPVFMVSMDDILQYLSQAPYADDKDKLLEHFDEDADEFSFAPSAIAIHPITGQIYILSSVGKLLLVLNADGKIDYIEKLKKKIHRQPEGLCFDPDGTMYLSNEGKDGDPGKIYVFKAK